MTDQRVPNLDELVTRLSSPNIMDRVDTIYELTRQPEAYRKLLAAILADAKLDTRPRVWAMLAVSQIRDGGDPVLLHALTSCLDDPGAIIRRSALEILGILQIHAAVPQIAARLSDHAPIPEAWFDDESTPAQAAKRALEAMGTAEARAFLAATPGERDTK